MLLSRMNSNPEEFSEDDPDKKWAWVMDAVVARVELMGTKPPARVMPLAFLTDEEIMALYGKYVSLQGDAFSRKVMATLLVAG